MNPAKPTPPAVSTALKRPAPPGAPAPRAKAPAAPRLPGVPLAVVGLALGLVGVALAAGLAYGLASLLGAAGLPWAASLGAALGVAVAGTPLGWLVYKLARDFSPGAGRSAPGFAPGAGMARPLFMDLAEREFARARRYGTGAALLLIDVDRFARLCEARGGQAGEAVLAQLLGQTAPTLRTADVLTQLGSAQMAVFLAQADPTGALDVAERIRDRAEHLEVPPPEGQQAPALRITVSAGVAQLRPAHLNLQALIDDAQEAVAAARQAGGNCVRSAPVDLGAGGIPGPWRERRARPKQGGSA